MKKNIISLFLPLLVAGSLGLTAFAKDEPVGGGTGKPAASDPRQDAYHEKTASLMGELKNAATDEQRKEIRGRIKKAREEYRAANPPAELTPAEKEARRLKMEESLRKDPARWEIYQLRQSMAKAGTQQEREGYRARLKDLTAKHAAEAEAKLTPGQRAAAQSRKARNIQMQAELKPFNDKLRDARTKEERKAIHAQMEEVFKKYR